MKKLLLMLIIIMLVSPLGTVTGQIGDVKDHTASGPLEYFADERSALEALRSSASTSIPRSFSRALDVPSGTVQQAIAHILNRISQDQQESFLTKLVGFKSRLYRAPGMFNASIWLYEVLRGNGGLTAEYQNFTVVRPAGTFVLSNVILTLPGKNTSSDRIYYVFAHSDAVQSTDSSQWLTNTPGADDDGSGCTAVLEAARVLSRYQFQDTIKFAFFNAEEIGLVGSAVYAQSMADRGENVPASIDFDMIGYSTGSPFYGLDVMFNPVSADIGNYLLGVNERYGIGLGMTLYQTTGSIASDISSFYGQGFPGAFAIETEFSPYYHTTSDLVKYINFSFLHKTTVLGTAALAEWARLLYADLSIPVETIKPSTLQPSEDDDVRIDINVSNSGNIDAPDVEVVFNEDGFPFASTRLGVPANSTNSTFAIWRAREGKHNISITVDPTNEVVESDETNNTAWMKIEVNDRPNAVLTAVPLTVLTYENVTFNASLSRDDVGGIASYNFSFGDGNCTNWIDANAIEYQYAEDGTYYASLTVRDARDEISEPMVVEITVLNRAPVASPSSNRTLSLTFVPIHFISNATDPDGSVTVQWLFGDGATSKSGSLDHEYPKSGEYTVQLKLTDNDGATSAYDLDIIILNRPPVCNISAGTMNGTIKTLFGFNAVASDRDGKIDYYEWDLGDGTIITDSTAEHRYAEPGSYLVTLLVRDDEGATCSSRLKIEVIDQSPFAIAEASDHEVYTNEQISFDGTDSHDLEGALTFVWDFGDGNTSVSEAPLHSYARPGSYNASLSVMDSARQTARMSLEPIIVHNRQPIARLRVYGNLSVNGTVIFDGSDSEDAEGDLNYSWDFGDDGSGYGIVAAHIYTEPGTYMAYLKVTDENGETDVVQYIVSIKPGPSGTAPSTREKSNDEGSFFFNQVNALLLLNLIWIIILILVILIFTKRLRNIRREQTAPPPLQPFDAAYPIPSQQGSGGYPQLGTIKPVDTLPVGEQSAHVVDIVPIPAMPVPFQGSQPQLQGPQFVSPAPIPSVPVSGAVDYNAQQSRPVHPIGYGDPR